MSVYINFITRKSMILFIEFYLEIILYYSTYL